MQILGHFCLLLVVCSVLYFYKRILEYILWFSLMECVPRLKFLSQKSDFGCWFLLLGCFRHFFNGLGLFLLFGFGLKVLQFCHHFKASAQFLCDIRGKSSGMRNRFCSKHCFDETSNSDPPKIDKVEETQEIANGNGGDDTDEPGSCDEDEVFDVMSLRKLVKIERKQASAAYLELEKERIAAATAAEEAMAMILRLQNEKSLIEMEANQYRRLVEEKQLHDQEVIRSLRWIVMKHESERSLLEDQLKFFRQQLKLCEKGNERDQPFITESVSFFNSNIEGSSGDALISSLDIDLSPQP